MSGASMAAAEALTEHLLWCAEQALLVWEAYFPQDRRPRLALETYRAHLRNPTDMKTLTAAFLASDDAYQAAEQTSHVANAHAPFAATYAARAVARCIANAPSADVLREVRLMSAIAQAYHAVVLYHRNGGSPQELTRVEAETMEAVQAKQDNDLRERMGEPR